MTQEQYEATNNIQRTIQMLNEFVQAGQDVGVETILEIDRTGGAFSHRPISMVTTTFKFTPYTPKASKASFE